MTIRAVALACNYDGVRQAFVGLGSPRYVFPAFFGKTVSRLRQHWRFRTVTTPCYPRDLAVTRRCHPRL